MAKPLITINFLSTNKSVVASQGCTILQAAIANKIEVEHSCGGNGTCGTCRVEIVSGQENVGARNDLESEFASERGFNEDERLACQTEVYGSVTVRTI